LEKFKNRIIYECSTEEIAHVKSIVAIIIEYQSTDFYLSSHAKYLNESKILRIYDLKGKEISVIFRIKGGSDILNLDNNVLATSHQISLHRPYFLDKDNSPNNRLLVIEFSSTSFCYNPPTNVQHHLTALLPTEIMQSLGSKIIAIMNRDKIN